MWTTQTRALVDRLIHIGAQLSSERDLAQLLEMIVEESRRFTGADGGTLFLVNEATRCLDWAIIQNETMGVRLGGRAPGRPDASIFSPIPLHSEDGAHLLNVAAAVALSGQPVNICDVYDQSDAFDFTGPQRFDAQTGYRTRSMLVVPLTHFEGGVIGVLQLINARDARGQLVDFAQDFEALTASLASQAAVAVKNAQLFDELEAQFEAFIRTIALAIDEKSAYTSGHVRRVVELTLSLARAVDQAQDGPLAHVRFDEDAIKALRVAAWMHDVGKIASPEHVVDKATKLSALWDRIALIETRYALLLCALERDTARQLIEAPHQRDVLEAALARASAALVDELDFLRQCNQGVERMSDEALARLRHIAQQTFIDPHGQAQPRLTPDELKHLSVRKGTLTEDEIAIIREHAMISYKMLAQLPLSRHLARVPEIAAGHHEKLNGKGYPRGLTASQLSVEARILAIADIFEALTASDRPYKKPTPLSGVRRIMEAMVRDGELDGDLVALAMRSGVFDEYAAREVSPAQRDLRLSSASLVQEPDEASGSAGSSAAASDDASEPISQPISQPTSEPSP